VGVVGRDKLRAAGPSGSFYFVSLCSVRRLHLGQNFFSVSLSLCPGFLNFVVW